LGDSSAGGGGGGGEEGEDDEEDAAAACVGDDAAASGKVELALVSVTSSVEDGREERCLTKIVPPLGRRSLRQARRRAGNTHWWARRSIEPV